MSTIKGTVKWFNGQKRIWFYRKEDKEKDAFVYVLALLKAAGMRYLNEGDEGRV